MSTKCGSKGCDRYVHDNDAAKGSTICADCVNIGKPGEVIRDATDEIADLYQVWGSKSNFTADTIRKAIERSKSIGPLDPTACPFCGNSGTPHGTMGGKKMIGCDCCGILVRESVWRRRHVGGVIERNKQTQ